MKCFEIFRNMRQSKTTFIKGLLVGGAVVLIAVSLRSAPPAMQIAVLPGSAQHGEQILEDKGCLGCHSLDGRGGNRAPDFVRSSGKARTPGLFASAMWNHVPRMFAEFDAVGRRVPALSSSEVADLFAYFYATLYLAPQGSATRGRKVFAEKACINCHSEFLDRSQMSTLRTGTDLRDPVAWAERMWNHASEMDIALNNKGIRWPKLTEQDAVDLLMFLSGAPESQTRMPSFNIGEPEIGRVVFERSCESCHSFGQAVGKSKVDLLARSGHSSLIGYVAAMWNHAPDMRRRGGSTAKLDSGEMSDLISFLFSQRYFFESGNATRGRRVYEDKGCVKCHDNRSNETGAPDLSQVTEVFSPITLTSAAWRHGSSMMERMKRQGIAWPQFKGTEMEDLIAYLNSKLVVRLASPYR